MAWHITAILSMLAIGTFAATLPSQADDQEKLIGTWKLLSAVSEPAWQTVRVVMDEA